MLRKILVVDDEPIQRNALKTMLIRVLDAMPVKEDVEIRQAETACRALEMVNHWRPQLCFMDIRMPGMSGLSATHVITKEQRQHCLVVILSAYDEFKYAQDALNAGAMAYLLKPVDATELRGVVEQARERLHRWQMEKDIVEQLEHALPYMTVELIQDTVKGRIVTDEVFLKRAQLVGVNTIPSLVWLISAEPLNAQEHLSEGQRQLEKERLYQLAVEMLPKGILTSRMENDQLIILCSPPQGIYGQEAQDQWQHQLAKELVERVSEQGDWQLTIGLGSPATSIAALAESYIEAQEALSYRYIIGANQVIHIDDIDTTLRIDTKYPWKIEGEMQEAMRFGQEVVAQEALRKLIAYYTELHHTIGLDMRYALLELSVLVGRAAVGGGADHGLISLRIMQALEQYDDRQLTEDALEQWLYDFVKDGCQEVQKAANLRQHNLIAKAVNYLKENYKKNVSLEDMARLVHLSPYYFSHLFKEEMGVNFIEYLTSLRIEAAKEKLRTTQMYVGSIAEDVGYSDVNYFSRVFKKVTGVTPSAYRQANAEL